MTLSPTHKTAIEQAAKDYHAANATVEKLQRAAQQIPPEGMENFMVEFSQARAEAVAAQRVLESLVRSA